MILPDSALMRLGLKGELLIPFEEEMVNPASIDIRVGYELIRETLGGERVTTRLSAYSKEDPYLLVPGEFVLVSTLERIKVPLDLAMELKLKSSRAREGYNHLLAFWFDPGWDGIGTLEIVNVNRFTKLPLYPGLRIGQIIYHLLSEPVTKPYTGRYHNATGVESAKAGS